MGRSVWLLAALTACSACSGSPAPGEAEQPAGERPAGLEPDVETGSIEGEAASAAPAPLGVVAVVPEDARFVPIDGKTFVVAAGPTLLELESASVAYDGRKAAGMEKPFDDYGAGEIATLMGRWPEQAWLGLNLPAVVGGSYLYRWSGERWEKEGTSKWRAIDSSRWKDGRSVVLLEREDRKKTRLAEVPNEKTPIPSFHDESGACRIIGRRVVAFVTGEIVVQGDPCDGSVGGVLGFWKSGEARGVVLELPRIEGRGFGISAMVARSPSDIYLAGWSGPDPAHPHAAYLARFDGKEVSLQKAPTHLPLTDVAVAESTLYIVESPPGGGRTLWRRDRSGEWSKVALPSYDDKPVEPRDVWVRGPGDVWVIGTAGRRGVVLHSGAKGKVVEHGRTSVSEYQSLGEPTERCNPLLVILGKRGALDEGAVRKALAGSGGRQLLVDFQRRGDLLMGAVAYTLPMARGIEKAIKDNVSGASPEIVCHEPRHKVRQQVFDPKTKRWQVHQL